MEQLTPEQAIEAQVVMFLFSVIFFITLGCFIARLLSPFDPNRPWEYKFKDKKKK